MNSNIYKTAMAAMRKYAAVKDIEKTHPKAALGTMDNGISPIDKPAQALPVAKTTPEERAARAAQLRQAQQYIQGRRGLAGSRRERDLGAVDSFVPPVPTKQDIQNAYDSYNWQQVPIPQTQRKTPWYLGSLLTSSLIRRFRGFPKLNWLIK